MRFTLIQGAITRLVLVVLSFSVAVPVSASNLLFLSNSVLSELTKEDAQSFRSAIQQALDSVEDRDSVTWRSESSSIKASIRPLTTYQLGAEQQTCRRARFVLAHSDRPVERYQFDFCHADEGWNIAHTPASSFNKDDWILLEQTLQHTLNDNENGEASSWTNHRSKSSGVLVPISNEMRQGQPCRQTAVTIFNKQGQASNGSYLFCRDETGDWNRLVD
ncbi:MAG: hypothetical protein V7707_13020 [Motiliproteus sp.]